MPHPGSVIAVGWKVVTGAYFKVRSYFARVSDFQLQSNLLMAVSSAQKYKPLQSRHNNTIIVPNYFNNTTYPTRHHHPFHFEIPFARTDHYKFSYYPKSIRDWNNLPTDTIESQSLQVFLDKL